MTDPAADGTTRTARGDALAPRPALRGWFHAVSFPVMATLGLVLVLASDVSLHGRVLLATYVGGTCAMFGASAMYHRVQIGRAHV